MESFNDIQALLSSSLRTIYQTSFGPRRSLDPAIPLPKPINPSFLTESRAVRAACFLGPQSLWAPACCSGICMASGIRTEITPTAGRCRSLALFLCKFRWDDRPDPSPIRSGRRYLRALLCLLTLPARWLQEAAPERSICAWSYAVGVVGISLSLIALAGGVAWLRWFGFPVAFTLTAVPWPHSVESLISNSLMRGTAGVTVEILCLTGVPSAQAGNLVHIETGVIDIDEACSGIRSLQAMVMIALFLGELFRLKPARRWLLVAFGLTVTLLANILRTVALSSIGFRHGMGAVDRYHDAAGAAVLILSLASTLGAGIPAAFGKGLRADSRTRPGCPRRFPSGSALPCSSGS